MKIVNLTPHDVNIFNKTGDEIIKTIPTTMDKKNPVRIKEQVDSFPPINEIPVVSKKYTEIENLPKETDGTIYIVSVLVLNANKNRKDLYSPDTGPDSVIRNESGHILGVKRLQK